MQVFGWLLYYLINFSRLWESHQKVALAFLSPTATATSVIIVRPLVGFVCRKGGSKCPRAKRHYQNDQLGSPEKRRKRETSKNTYSANYWYETSRSGSRSRRTRHSRGHPLCHPSHSSLQRCHLLVHPSRASHRLFHQCLKKRKTKGVDRCGEY